MSATLTAVESLYAGPVGDSHFARVQRMTFPRAAFWRDVLVETFPFSVLEVGCGAGVNAWYLGSWSRYTAIDISMTALHLTRPYSPRLAQASAARLPFPNQSFDLVVSSGLAMHLSEDAVPAVFDELARVSRRHVLFAEYEDTHRRSIVWHGVNDALWAAPFSMTFWRQHPEFAPCWRKSLTKSDGFDRTEASIFQRRD